MQQFYQVCPVVPQNGSCPESMVWVEAGTAGLTVEQFHSILPQIVTVLLFAWGVRLLIRTILNKR